MQISNTCGAPPYTLTISFQDRFSSRKASASVSPTLGICNPNSILDLPCTILSTESTAAHASIFSSPTNGWFRQNWHCGTGKIMTTCIYGLPSQYTQREMTIAVSKWPSSKSGNPDSTTLSFVNLPSQKGHPQETSPQYERPVWPGHLMASCQTQVHSETCSQNPDIHTVSKPFGPPDHHPCLGIKYKGKVRTDEDAQIE